MLSREILLYHSLKFNGDWDQIYTSLQTTKEADINLNEFSKLRKKINSKYITILDEEYPEQLKQVTKPPFVLYYHGDVSLIKSEHILGVVGSRKFTSYGEETTKRFVSQLQKDFVIISGMAIGIDAIAHRTTIENGGKTIAVLGCGINVCYLDCNRDIYDFCCKKGLVISEYPDNTPPKPGNFPIRNRIIAGLLHTLLVVEGKNYSGTTVTASLSVGLNKDVCCVPERIGKNSICNSFIKEGAFLVETPEDVYCASGVRPKKPIFEK